jgi:hypothetical protein
MPDLRHMCLISDITVISHDGEEEDCYLLGATLSSQVQISLLFARTYSLHLQDRKVNKALNKQALFLLLDFCLSGLLFDPEDGENICLRNG